MDQILVGLSVCCPPQSEHLDIRKVANSHAHVGVILKRRLKCPKTHVLLLLLFSLSSSSHLYCPGSFLGTATDTVFIFFSFYFLSL